MKRSPVALRRLAAVALAATFLGGCVSARTVNADVPGESPVTRFFVGPDVRYVVDSLSETCFLELQSQGAAGPNLVEISCERLAANLPEARRHITWTVSAPR